ncbi:MAG: succinate dehydrogenase [Acidobacteriota bacterium]|nr:succinate dehydrogenase [Acidobacteriota bacterium]MDH3785531.1 succinate dehydrogenase [Acidobacteriota bacterium]
MGTTQLLADGGHPEGIAAGRRDDRWWLGVVTTAIILTLFVIYSTWAAFQGNHYYAAPYLSPFYSPVLFTETSMPGSAPLFHSAFGAWPEWWPDFLPTSPAFFILAFPGLFRFTCYYYRKAYYRSFTGSPPGCALVPAAKKMRKYHGETRLLILNNLHRYALYGALLFLPILWADVVASFVRNGEIGVGVGSGVLFMNATLLSGYTFGCHSFRHLIAGQKDCMSCGKQTLRFRMWKGSTWLNVFHARFAWLSLFWVAFSDIYVRLVSMGTIRDFNTWG